MSRTPAPVAGALELRAWALATLCAPSPPLSPPDVPDAAWDRFLCVERCALALSRRAGQAVSGAAAACLGGYARTESRMVLSAQAQLRRISALAREAGAGVAVLKGGVPLLRGGSGPWLMDLDLLARPADAAALAQRLDGAGYRAHGSAASHRLAVRAADNDVPLEIHTSVPGLSGGDVWERLRPAPGASGLLMLHPADHLHYLLLHSALQHADRRGRLRDLLLIAEALEHCAPEDVERVRAGVETARHAQVLRGQLEMARALVLRTGLVRDPFELTAAGTYLLYGTLDERRVRGVVGELAWQSVTAAVARRGGAPASLGEHGLELPSAHPGLVRLRRMSPRLERAARTVVRRAREWSLFPLGLSIAAAAERAVSERAAAAGE